LASVMLLSVSVCADILWEPYGDDYYNDHHQDMSYVDAAYFVPEGMRVNVYDEPNGEVLYTMEAGTTVYVGYQTTIYDTIWAVGYSTDLHSEEGWFRLGRLQKQYNTDDFRDDYADQIQSQEAIPAATDPDGMVLMWTYPGSGVYEGSVTLSGMLEDWFPGNIPVYTDPNGGKWGYLSYFYGMSGWVYLDDPTNPDPGFLLNPIPESTVTDTAPEEDREQVAAQRVQDSDAPNISHIIVVCCLVGAVTIGTAIAIILLKRRHKNPPAQQGADCQESNISDDR